MARCDLCKQFDDCAFRSDPDAMCSAFKQRPMTNGDRIRSMTDEKLADSVMCFIRCEACEKVFHIGCSPLMTCRGIWLNWLKQEAKE